MVGEDEAFEGEAVLLACFRLFLHADGEFAVVANGEDGFFDVILIFETVSCRVIPEIVAVEGGSFGFGVVEGDCERSVALVYNAVFHFVGAFGRACNFLTDFVGDIGSCFVVGKPAVCAVVDPVVERVIPAAGRTYHFGGFAVFGDSPCGGVVGVVNVHHVGFDEE